jgi:hypothetical protein
LQDTKLFETILGITAPWHIARVELTTDEKRSRFVAGARADAMAVS